MPLAATTDGLTLAFRRDALRFLALGRDGRTSKSKFAWSARLHAGVLALGLQFFDNCIG